MQTNHLYDLTSRLATAARNAVDNAWPELQQHVRATCSISHETDIETAYLSDPDVATFLHDAAAQVAELAATQTIATFTSRERRTLATGLNTRTTTPAGLTEALKHHPLLSSYIEEPATTWKQLIGTPSG